MKIIFTKDDGEVLEEIQVKETSRPDIEDLNDDNIYLDEPDSVEEMCFNALKYCQRALLK